MAEHTDDLLQLFAKNSRVSMDRLTALRKALAEARAARPRRNRNRLVPPFSGRRATAAEEPVDVRTVRLRHQSERA